MKTLKNKIFAIAVALLLTLSMAASLTLIQNAKAHTPPQNIRTWMYCTAQPAVAGVGQPIEVVFWLNWIPPTANGEFGDRWTLTLNVTLPDGTTQNLGTFTSDPIGSSVYIYTPTALGNYTFVASFEQHLLNNQPPNTLTPSIAENTSPYINDTFLASTSMPATVTVQSTPVVPTITPVNPLPTGYWTFPISPVNSNWYMLAGNWLVTTWPVVMGYQPYSTAPTTPHIMWTKQLNLGGVAGGLTGQATVGGATDYYTGSSYETQFSAYLDNLPPIIIDGNLYYNEIDVGDHIGFYSVNLATGQENYFVNSTVGTYQNGYGTSGEGGEPQLSFGQIYDYNSVNQNGAFPYLWSEWVNTTAGAATGPYPTTNDVWTMYDASTGTPICNINNVPVACTNTGLGGQIVDGPNIIYSSGNVTSIMVTSPVDGSELVYVMNPVAGWLALWNSSYCIQQATYAAGGNTYWEWRPYVGYTYNGLTGYQWNVTIAKNLWGLTVAATTANYGATMDYVILPGGAQSTSAPTEILGNWGLGGGAYTTNAYSVWAISLNPSTLGQTLWQDNFNEPQNDPANANMTTQIMGADGQSGVFVMRDKESTQMYGYSLTTGALLWGPTVPENPWNMFISPNYQYLTTIANGIYYDYGYAGFMNAYNITTGALMWSSPTNPSAPQGPYLNWPFGDAAGSVYAVVAGGEIIDTTNEHSTSEPLYRDWATYAWNATTGANIWNMTGIFGTSPIIGDGYMAVQNSYNGEITVLGRGPSATTVAATPGQNSNSQVLITGTVTDQSSGETCLGIPAAGTPAISDADMTAWMQYLYLQYPEPTNVTGVPVTLTDIDPNGNSYTIGTTTSNIEGQYNFAFTPTVPGVYTIIATFGGSGSYWPSSAQTSYLFDQPAASAAAPTATPTSVADMYFVPAIAGIIVVIIIGFIVLALLMLRKKP